jgi:hypothetical protein
MVRTFAQNSARISERAACVLQGTYGGACGYGKGTFQTAENPSINKTDWGKRLFDRWIRAIQT